MTSSNADTPLPAGSGIRPARRRSLPQEIADQLLELISNANTAQIRLPPEKALCEQLGVSRTSLREALSALTQMGILEVQGKAKLGIATRARAQLLARARADSPERELLTDPLEARRILEPEVAARAAERATDREVEDIAAALKAMEDAASRGEPIADHDSAFHTSIALATRNHTLVELVRALTDGLRHSRALSFLPEDATSRAITDHHAILEALAARDPIRARREMRKHLDHVERLIRSSMEADSHSR